MLLRRRCGCLAASARPVADPNHGPPVRLADGPVAMTHDRDLLRRVITASGSRDVPAARATVWRALAVLSPYCAVCDVSYVVSGKPRKGTTFVCVPGRLGDGPPAEGSPRGEI